MPAVYQQHKSLRSLFIAEGAPVWCPGAWCQVCSLNWWLMQAKFCLLKPVSWLS